MIELGELEFTPKEIFNAFRESQDLVYPGTADSNDTLAFVLNRILREKLGKAKKVYGNENGGEIYWGEEDDEGRDTHTGRLVCIEEVKK